MKQLLIIAVCLLLAHAANGQTTWTANNNHWQADYVIDITAGRAAPSSPEVLYAADRPTLLKSINGGDAWAPTGDPISSPRAVVCDPLNPLKVLVGVNQYVRMSTNGGLNWDDKIYDLSLLPLTLAIAKGNQNLMFAGVEKVSLQFSMYRSPDGGLTWDRVEYFFGNVKTDINAIATLATDPLRVWAAGSKPVYAAGKVLDDPLDETGDTLNGVFFSQNGGLDWRSIGLRGNDVLAVGAYQDGGVVHLWAGTKTGLLRYSSNNGVTWTSSSLWGLPAAIDVITDIKTDGNKVYLATDEGVWIKSGTAWNAQFVQSVSGIFDYSIQTLELSPQSGMTVYAAGRNSIYRSTDGGQAWTSSAR